MKIISKRKHGINFYTVWFAKEPLKKRGIIQYRQAEFKPDNAEEFVTQITDLTKMEDEIIAGFAKNCRYEVSRAQREGVEVLFFESDSLSKEEIEAFIKFFSDFWNSKGVNDFNKESLREEITEYIKNNAFVISKAVIGGETVVYHTYFVDDVNSRLLHSSSLYRCDEKISANLIGMANRYLHKEDIMYFKSKGKKIYDWGGAGTSKEVENITKFKKSFGGEEVIQYNARVHSGLIANLFRILIERG